MSRQSGDDLLAKLIASTPGTAIDYVVLGSFIEEACEAGAYRALASLGLADEKARRDMDELRELLGTWRDVKRSAWQAAARWLVRVLLALLMLGMAFRLDLLKLLDR